MTAAQLMCPTCEGRFRAGFTRCGTCKVDLVDVATFNATKAGVDRPRQQLEGRKVVAVTHASIDACREIERALLAGGIACYVANDVDESEAIAAKIGVFVAEDDLPRVGVVMKQRFADLVKSEGRGTFNTEAIDVSAAEVECPACGHKGALKAGECADCGLFLGAPDA